MILAIPRKIFKLFGACESIFLNIIKIETFQSMGSEWRPVYLALKITCGIAKTKEPVNPVSYSLLIYTGSQRSAARGLPGDSHDRDQDIVQT